VSDTERSSVPKETYSLCACVKVLHAEEASLAMLNKHVQRFHHKITKLKNLLAHLAKTIVEEDAKHLLLDTAKNSLAVVERCLLSHGFKATNDNTEMWFRLIEFHLEMAEEELMYAKGVVAKDGATVQMIG